MSGHRLPPGVIDSAGMFLLAIKTAGADQVLAPAQLDEAVEILEKQFRERMDSIDRDWKDTERQYRMAFWTGALLGEKIALRGYMMRLEQLKRGDDPSLVET